MSGLIVEISSSVAASRNASPTRTIGRAGQREPRRDAAAAVSSIVTDTGSILRPVWNASKPCTTCR